MRAFDFTRQYITEVNFNDPKLVGKVLAIPQIHAGFEAEAIWPLVEPATTNLSFEEIYDNMTPAEKNSMTSSYQRYLKTTPLYTKSFNKILSQLVKEKFNTQIEMFVRRFYQDEFDESDMTDQEFLYDRNLESEYEEWLADMYKSTAAARAIVDSQKSYSLKEWALDEYISLENLAVEFGLLETLPSKLDAVSDTVHEWAATRSAYSGWHVVEDTSIKNFINEDDVGAEVVSPPFESGNDLLSEMENLFTLFDKHKVYTNNSTGLHVTMSWNGERAEPNKLKMILLLGDTYLLQTFNRLKNEFTKSQLEIIKSYVDDSSINPNDVSKLKEVEEILYDFISNNKYVSVNFKDEKNQSGNQLIEFRIGGGSNYQHRMDLIKKAVVRYSTVMWAGYDPAAFRQDYIKMLSRLLRSTTSTPKPVTATSVPILPVISKMVSNRAYPGIADMITHAYDIVNTNAVTAQISFAKAMKSVCTDIYNRTLTTDMKVDANTTIMFRKALKDMQFANVNALYNQLYSISNSIGDRTRAMKIYKTMLENIFKVNISA